MPKVIELHRIPYNVWSCSYLSVARFWGGINVDGKFYEYDHKTMRAMAKCKDPDKLFKPDLVHYQIQKGKGKS